MNAMFIVAGFCHAAGAVALYPAWPRGLRGGLGSALMTVAGVGLMVAGAAPENVSAQIHAIAALSGLVCLNLAMIVLGSSIIDAARWLAIISNGAGALGFLGVGLFLNRAVGVPVGLAERLAGYPAAAMVVVFGAFALVNALLGKRSTDTHRRVG